MAVGVGVAVIVTQTGAVVAFALYRFASEFYFPEAAVAVGPLAWAAAALPVVALATLSVLHACLPVIGRWPWGRALHVHALHGFYVGAFADRLVARVWSAR